MKEKRKRGNPRMTQLARKKYEVWFYDGSGSEVAQFAASLNMPVAKFLRHCAKYMMRGGVDFAKIVRSNLYD